MNRTGPCIETQRIHCVCVHGTLGSHVCHIMINVITSEPCVTRKYDVQTARTETCLAV